MGVGSTRQGVGLKSRAFILAALAFFASATIAAGCGRAQPTPPPVSWNAYWNRWYGYEIRYPPDGSVVENIGGSSTVVYLLAGDQPFAPTDQMVLLTAMHAGAECVIPGKLDAPEARPEELRIGALKFTKYEGRSGAAPFETTWESYATAQDGACVVITYAVRPPSPSTTGGTRATPSPEDARLQFDGMLASFAWTGVK